MKTVVLLNDIVQGPGIKFNPPTQTRLSFL
jgi:hypothetical protein